MKKKVFFTFGISLFVIGMIYLNANYEISYYPESSSSVALESRSIDEGGVIQMEVQQEQKEGLRIGNFVISKKK